MTAPVPAATPPSRRPSIGRALSSRNYRLFFGGQSVSLVGTWITRIATSWLVYRLTGSALLLGVVGFCSQIPTLILTPFSGVLFDRWNRHTVLVVTQILSMLKISISPEVNALGTVMILVTVGIPLIGGLILQSLTRFRKKAT